MQFLGAEHLSLLEDESSDKSEVVKKFKIGKSMLTGDLHYKSMNLVGCCIHLKCQKKLIKPFLVNIGQNSREAK